MRFRHWFSLPILAALFLIGSSQAQIEGEKKKGIVSFGVLEGPNLEAAKAQALAWLKQSGKADEAALRQFETIWVHTDRPVLDLVADTLALGDETAAKLLDQARNPLAPAPTAVPDVLRDAKRPLFYRANLALAFARSLSNRRIHEEALETLKTVLPEQVVDASAYLFHRAVCEHALLMKAEAGKTINRLLEDAVDAPDRYKTVAMLMLLDMQTWQNKDLGAVARKMDIVERRLELARGGPQTQKVQKEIINRLDELIKELENKAKKGGS